MRTRWFVLIEPFRLRDVTICRSAASATAEARRIGLTGRTTRVVETSGSLLDLRPIQTRLRAELTGATS